PEPGLSVLVNTMLFFVRLGALGAFVVEVMLLFVKAYQGLVLL
ncbi:MAG: hypothetical protein H6Q00_3528, partial [Holophagaceae bacterium]|nr:hypothetical protein [Holophagaceae bacterium]